MSRRPTKYTLYARVPIQINGLPIGLTRAETVARRVTKEQARLTYVKFVMEHPAESVTIIQHLSNDRTIRREPEELL